MAVLKVEYEEKLSTLIRDNKNNISTQEANEKIQVVSVGEQVLVSPVDGVVKKVGHQNGKFMKAWLPKASTDNERSMVVIETPEGVEVMARQIAGAMARRIVTYATEGEECFIDEHMGFIKFGSRVDVYLPVGTKVLVEMGQRTTGNQTIIAQL